MRRRSFLKASAIAPAVVAFEATSSRSNDKSEPLLQLSAELDTTLFSPDGLAIPIADAPKTSPLAEGLDRTLVLGGGGEWYVAWYCGFFHGLMEQGLDASALAEMIVGTSEDKRGSQGRLDCDASDHWTLRASRRQSPQRRCSGARSGIFDWR